MNRMRRQVVISLLPFIAINRAVVTLYGIRLLLGYNDNIDGKSQSWWKYE
jgi:hypothetical protein